MNLYGILATENYGDKANELIEMVSPLFKAVITLRTQRFISLPGYTRGTSVIIWKLIN